MVQVEMLRVDILNNVPVKTPMWLNTIHSRCGWNDPLMKTQAPVSNRSEHILLRLQAGISRRV